MRVNRTGWSRAGNEIGPAVLVLYGTLDMNARTESTRSGADATDHPQCVSMTGRGLLCRLDRLFRMAVIGLLCFSAWGATQAQSTNYVYDANGRAVAVTASSGSSVQYSYNTLGHIVQVSTPLSPGQLAIFAFLPVHGEVGVPVTIEGQGFSSNAANDVVSFNGIAAAVQLVVDVPGGASTGPISVTVGGQTVTSATSFLVDGTGVPPVITQISPTVVASGGTVTVSGEHLYPVPTSTALEIGNSPVSLTSANDTQLQFNITGTTSSGYVTIQTPYGRVISSTPVVVVPNTMTTASVVSSGFTSAGGAPVALSVGGAGQVGAVTFNASANKWLSLQATGISSTANNINYAIYAPGNVLIQQGTVSSSSPSIHLPKLTASGTYLATFQPDTAGAQLTVAVEADTTVTIGTPLPIATNTASRSERLIFTLSAANNMEVALDSLNVVGGSSNGVQVSVYNSAGTNVASFNCCSSYAGATGRLAAWNLVADTYSMVVTPSVGGTMSFNALVQQDLIGPALTPGATTAVNLAAGQLERFTFNANAGDTYALQLSGVTTTPTAQTMYVYVYSPSTTTLTPSNFYTSFTATSSSTINLSNLPVTGTYTVMVFTTGIPGSGQLTLAPGVTGSLPDGGAAQSYSTSASGQNAYLSFSANAGANLELSLTNLSVSAGSGVGVSVYSASGAYITGFTCSTSYAGGACRLALWNLAAGTYSVLVSPNSGGTMSFNAMVQPDLIGPTLTSGTAASVNLAVGQLERFTFSANAGDTYALQLSGVSTTPVNQAMYVYVYSPTTTTITASNYYTSFTTSSSSAINLANLPATGTYTVMVFTTGLPASGQLALASALTGSITSTSQSYTTNVSDQSAKLSFTANAGDDLELTLDNLTVAGGSGVQVSVYGAAGGSVGSFDCYPSSVGATCRSALWNLAAGMYSVVVTPLSGGTMSFNALLQPDMVGSALVPGAPVAVNLGTGQVERFTFNANAGDTYALQLSGVSTTPTGQAVSVNLYSPATGTITISDYYTNFAATGATVVNLPNLPAGGTYTLAVYTSGIPGSAQLTLVPGVAGTLSDNGAAQSFNASVAGQNAYLTFTANAGDNLELTLDNVNVVGGSGVQMNLYNATGTNIGSFTCNNTDPGATRRLALWNLAAGKYSAVITPLGNGTINFGALLQSDTIGTTLTANTSTPINLGIGQLERLTFSANAGDSYALQLSGVTTSPANQTMYVYVYDPTTETITPSDYSNAMLVTGTSTMNLSNLPTSGTYNVIIFTTGIPASGQLTLIPQ